MKVLVVKMSSIGDVLQTLPALTDAARVVRGIRFDWVVEENLAEIPAWHPAVDTVIPVALRRWRKAIGRTGSSGEWGRYREQLRSRDYDIVIDAQGLLKSAVFATRLARGPSAGFDHRSAREPAAALFYDSRFNVAHGIHAVERTRRLFAAALGQPPPCGRGSYGIVGHFGGWAPTIPPYLVLVHGTSRPEKEWPLAHWRALVGMAAAAGLTVTLPWGTVAEARQAAEIAATSPRARVLARSTLADVAQHLVGASAVVSVDTGLAHLAAALDVPNVTLFGPTDPHLHGGYGERQVCLRSTPPGPGVGQGRHLAGLEPQTVWDSLQALLRTSRAPGRQRTVVA